jgi:probable rRNA maturation factor
VPLRLLKAAGEAAMRHARCPRGAELEVALTSDAVIRRINQKFLGRGGATDVLAFPYGDEVGRRVMGEVLISVERARAQARRVGWPVRCEVALLLIHGVLHLSGYDDHTSSGAARMRASERAILGRVCPRRG